MNKREMVAAEMAIEEAQQAMPEDELIGALEMFVRKYVVLPERAALVLACWSAATYFYQQFEIFPYLHVTSPVRECGKTRLGQVLCYIAANPLLLSGVPSEASLFRTVDSGEYTIVMDEIEGLRNGRNERAQAVLSILNSGYKKGAVVIRADGPNHETRRYSTYCPKVLIGIGSVPDTVRSRSIVVAMRRKKAGETVSRLLEKRSRAEAEPLREVLRKLGEVRGGAVLEVYEKLPEFPELSDRDEEIWQPLFAVCAVLAPDRVSELKLTAITMSADKAAGNADESIELRLLADVGSLLNQFADNIPSAELLAKLKGLEESPWSEPGRELTQARLSKMLKRFSVRSKTVRVGEKTPKGYAKADLLEAGSLYVGSEGATSATTQ